ncbi:hypothetical protein BGX28_007230 [Mortierella sp. GBA30]|nr:hypothetical protein BGX28_007230 [Mortierella sp. GBA30]
MANDLAAQAKNAIDNLYHRLFDQQQYRPQESTAPTVVESPVASQAASFFNSYFGGAGRGGEGRMGSSQSETLRGSQEYFDNENLKAFFSDHHHRLSTLFQSLTNRGAVVWGHWGQWDPVRTFDSILWNYTPDIQALQHRLGLDHLSETYHVDARVILLALTLPLVLLILTACVIRGAGHTSEDDVPRPSSTGRKADSKQGGSKKGNRADEKTRQSGGGVGASSKVASPKKGGKGKGSSGKGGVHDKEYGTATTHLGSSYGLSSWGAMVGSAGFYGGEIMNYKPIDIYAAMDDTSSRKDHDQHRTKKNHLGAARDTSKILSETENTNLAPSAQHAARTQADIKFHEENAAKKSKKARRAEKAAATAKDSKNDTKDQEHDGVDRTSRLEDIVQEHLGTYDAASKTEAKTQTQAQSVRSTVNSNKPMRARTQPPTSTHLESPDDIKIKQATQHAQQHQHQDHATAGRDFGSKILGFVQGSELLRNMDAFSGGILGSAVATVAALASTAETTASLIKENLPDSVTDFTEELKESFDHAMRTGGLEGTGAAFEEAVKEEEKGEKWGIREAISQIIKEDEEKAAAASAWSTTFVENTGASVGNNTPQRKSFSDVAATTTKVANSKSAQEKNEGSPPGKADQAPRKGSISYADKVKGASTSSIDAATAHATATEVAGRRRKPVHAEHENESYFLENDSGDEADNEPEYDDEAEEEEEEDDENVDDGSVYVHHATYDTTTITHATTKQHVQHGDGQRTRVHPHDEPSTSQREKRHVHVPIAGTGTKTRSKGARRRKSGGRATDKKQQEEFTIDEHGNKILVADVRRDSGFNLLA